MNRKHIFKTPILLLITFLAFSLLAGAGTAAAQDDDVQTQTETSQTIYDIIKSEPALSSFVALVEAGALSDNLQQDGPFTVFAPTNEAFAAFNTAAATDEDVTRTDILLYHVMNGHYTAADLAEKDAVMTLAGEFLFFNPTEVNDETGIQLNESVMVTRADIQASNGVVHIIDTVLTIPEGNDVFASDQGSPENSIVQVLEGDDRFDTLLALIEQAGLMGELQNTNANYTLFAPTDEAFEAADEVLVEEWLNDPEGALNTILSYHVVNDRLTINQIANDDFLPTLEGRAIAVTTDEDVQVYLNGRPIQEFNVLASNGIIHVMDEVVLP
jgi:transforming growth factor-beta-induced protein